MKVYTITRIENISKTQNPPQKRVKEKTRKFPKKPPHKIQKKIHRVLLKTLL